MELEQQQHAATDGPRASIPASATPTTPSSESSQHGPRSPPIADATSGKRANMDHDSLVTVRLSEPTPLHINTDLPPNLPPSRRSMFAGEYTPSGAMAEKMAEEEDTESERDLAPVTPASQPGASLEDELKEAGPSEEEEESDQVSELETDSDSEDEVNWEQLQETEDKESKQQDAGDSTAMLLARLEQENNKLATNPKSIKVRVVEKSASPARRPRPPSMAQLQQMVNGPTPSALRYSMVPPPPMTDLEFYMALVKDYQQTAARLPTLLSNKIRKGIPPPLRGVVWQSMSGSRDSALEDMFDSLTGETSPYEGIIGKDLGRSFPGVEMFRDPEGDGQRMLGRVLKCFSLYDQKIGYCQGLAFLVGPLLMHMPDKQAFCVLVRLMETYDLRACFLPDLSGLHVRIYQFRELLRQSLPVLSDHLEALQVEPSAFTSQWFLSFFAVTCPLPMLFRIYDVIFAEGISETSMRVALSLMRANQGRLLACTELEDAMQLLLSRGLWDCYHYNADEFVLDFVSLSDVVSREKLALLEQNYREAQIGSTSANVAPASETTTTTAASRFLGRLWTVSTSSNPRTGGAGALSPALVAPSRPLSMLRRSTSKQSLASTLNSMEAGSSNTSSSSSASSSASSAASVLSSASTDATSVSRDSAPADDPSAQSNKTATTTAAANSNNSRTSKDDNRYLHSQIEDLLTALSELQRNQALLADQLQREKEERSEDRRAVRSLLDGLRQKAGRESAAGPNNNNNNNNKDAGGEPAVQPTAEQLSDLLDAVEARFGSTPDNRRSSIPQTKSQLRDDLGRAKEQLSNELAKAQEYNRRAYDMEQELNSHRDQLKESHAHVRNLHQEKQRLEKQIHAMRVRASDAAPASSADANAWFSQAGTAGANGASPARGLRELKLGRSKSTPSQSGSYNNRSSSLLLRDSTSRDLVPAGPLTAPVSENDALLLELVQAKTAEAVARQEAEEAKQKLESLRRAFGLGPGDMPPAGANSNNNNTAAATAASQASAAATAAMGMFSRLTASTAAGSTPAPEQTAATTAATTATTQAAASAAPAAGGFWGWRR